MHARLRRPAVDFGCCEAHTANDSGAHCQFSICVSGDSYRRLRFAVAVRSEFPTRTITPFSRFVSFRENTGSLVNCERQGVDSIR
jgi:hypothetical protein